MLLPSLVRLRHSDLYTETPEDIFSSTLGSIFTDDVQNLHGDEADTVIVYENANHGELQVQTAKFTGEEQRRKFAHYLWNAGVLMAELVGGTPRFAAAQRQAERDAGWQPGQWWMDAVEEQHWSVAGEHVLELGAGVGLGGIVSALAGATEVAITDYPAPPILDAIRINVAKNLPSNLQPHTTVQGHLWGSSSTGFETDNAHRFTRILAADCLWMPAEHENLAQSMLQFLAESADARIYCIAGFHTGRAKVAPFFEAAVPQAGLEVEDIYEMDANGRRRSWAKERDGGCEDVGERKKWLIVARIRRRVERPRCRLSAPTSQSTA